VFGRPRIVGKPSNAKLVLFVVAGRSASRRLIYLKTGECLNRIVGVRG
jgi:hypothetical protein